MAFGNETQKPGDYYSFFYTIRFLVPTKPETFDEEGTPLSASEPVTSDALRSEDSAVGSDNSKTKFDESEDAKILRAFVSSVVIEGISSSAYKATVVLTPPYDDAVFILENRLIKFGAIMEIQWGYRGNGGETIASPTHLFRITQPKCQFGQTTTITLEGRDLHTVTAESRKCAMSWKRAQYKTDLDILKSILNGLGNRYEIDDKQVPAESTLRKDGAGEGYEQKESYSRFFKRVCDKHNIGWIVRENKLVLFDEDKIGTQSPAYQLLWRRGFTGGTFDDGYEIPVLEVTINPLLTLFAGVPAAKGSLMSKTDLDKNKVEQKRLDDTNVPQRHSPGDAQQTGTGTQPAPPVATESAAGPVVADPPLPVCATGEHTTATTREPNADGKLKTETTRTSQLANTTANVKIPGHPAVHPQMVVSLVGLPNIFSGNYLIKKVKHSLGPNYTCELELFSRVVTQDPSDGSGQRAKGSTSPSSSSTTGGTEPTPHSDNNKPVQ
jgi:phage protein D